MKNKNFSIEDKTHRRLKVMAAQNDVTLGKAIEQLLDIRDALLAAEHQEYLDEQEQNLFVAEVIRRNNEARARHEARSDVQGYKPHRGRACVGFGAKTSSIPSASASVS